MSVVLHVAVVGFHHKKGCQIEYCYPPMGDDGEVPQPWQNLPSLALPDGAHNVDQDVIYFLLPSLENTNRSVFGISCYRQISAEDLLNRGADITRSTVQKSVCVLSRVPLFGVLTAKLQLITQAYFNERDFAKVEVLSQMYDNLCEMFPTDSLDEHAAAMDISVRRLVKCFKHRTLALFKLLLLEKRVVFHIFPVHRLGEILVALVSLYPQLLEEGLFQAAAYCKSHGPSEVEMVTEADIALDFESGAGETANAEDELSPTDEVVPVESQISSGEKSETEKVDFRKEGKNEPVKNGVAKPLEDEEMSTVAQVEERKEVRRGGTRSEGEVGDEAGKGREQCSEEERGEPGGTSESDGVLNLKREEALDLPIDEILEERATVSHGPSSTINTDSFGFPLSIFTKGSLFHPYLSISFLDMIRSPGTRAYCVGATNALFIQRRDSIDVIVTVNDNDEGDLDILSPEVRRALTLSAADLRFADFLIKAVDASENSASWEGGDEWIRLQARAYLLSLMATVRANLRDTLGDFGEAFVDEWKLTNNYRVWSSGRYPDLASAVPGHPFAGGLGVSDVLLRVEHSMGGSEGGRRVVSAVANTGRYFSDTGLKMKSSISSWLRGGAHSHAS